MKQPPKSFTLDWVFFIIFLSLGIAYYIYIHFIPGTFYTILSIVYLPPLIKWIFEKTGFVIPRWIKVIFALFILWAMLAVGELIEMLEDYI